MTFTAYKKTRRLAAQPVLSLTSVRGIVGMSVGAVSEPRDPDNFCVQEYRNWCDSEILYLTQHYKI